MVEHWYRVTLRSKKSTGLEPALFLCISFLFEKIAGGDPKLDCSKIKSTFGWKPRWNLETAIEKTVEWTKCWKDGGDVRECMKKQVEEFLG